ncbi:ATP-dependent DNA helicase [Bacillus salitolerans]|uniref:ATP-dependent DNA helicase n=1 Tax=Bacillus salitolerans TaxID=1437434 RepID=A0ABW4LRN3_9BACI
MEKEMKVSVRGLVEYVFRSGSIESFVKSSSSFTEGTKAHQLVQAEYKEHDQKEVYLQALVELDSFTLSIEGRCDGLLHHEEGITLDEIKSTSLPLHTIEEDSYPVHWAQALCYGYMYSKDHALTSIHIQLTYVQRETQEQKRFNKAYSFYELETFMDKLVKNYAPYAELIIKNKQERIQSIKDLSFPFERYRAGQRKLAGAVYKTITEKKRLFALAPTGIGKTISTLFPSIKAIGESQADRLFYLTAKTITRTTAEESFALLHNNGLKMKIATLTAKDKICFKEETRCQSDYCEFANGYYDRINEAILDILRSEYLLTRPIIEKYAHKHRVCPFEFSVDLAYAVDAVICDYNYVFDPRVSFKRLYEEQKKETVVLIDEAHNLVDRGRAMYSAEVNKAPFLQLKRHFQANKKSELYRLSNKINQYFIEKRKQSNENEWSEKHFCTEFIELLTLFTQHVEGQLHHFEKDAIYELLLETYFQSNHFIKISTLYDERFVTLFNKQNSDVNVKLLCLDPSFLLKQYGKGFKSKIFFSATIFPLPFYKEMLGSEEGDYSIRIPSPFKKEQYNVTIHPVSTKYQHREDTKTKIAELIVQTYSNTIGNYLVFFPSYQYMSLLLEEVKTLSPSFKMIIQQREMDEKHREDFLHHFQDHPKQTLVGFGVLGGIFSEGVDLKGDRLNGVMIVGVGLPQLSYERSLMKDYFQTTGKNGYDYAYVYPGINKVWQAGGRLIRSERDHGRILLVDDRYNSTKYRQLLPKEWV